MDRRLGIIELARWWTAATQEARWMLLRKTLDARAPKDEAPSYADLRLAIILAEAEAGEVDESST